MVPKPERPLIREPQRLRAMSHPTRLAILEILGVDGAATATRCAELTGESVASCSYHLGMLAKYGFIAPAEGGQGREKPWRVVDREQNWSSEGMDEEGVLAVEALTETYIDHTAEQMKTAYRRMDREPESWRPGFGSSSGIAHLTLDEVVAVREELLAVIERYSDRYDDPAKRPPGARPVRLFLARWLVRPYDGPTDEEN